MTLISNENEKSYNLALKYLKYRPRSRSEIRHYLKGKNFSDKTIHLTVLRLESAGLIDDQEFARLWVENRRRFKPKGRYALKIELKKKGIKDDVIDLALKTDDEEKNAWTAVQTKLFRWEQLDKDDIKKKAFTFLRSRGFSFNICLELSERITEKTVFKELNLS